MWSFLAQQRHQRRVAVVPQPAGVEGAGDEVGPEGVHGHQRGHAGLVAEVVVEPALGRSSGGRLDRDHPGVLRRPASSRQQREGEAAEVGPAADAGDQHVGLDLGPFELHLQLQADDGLVEQHVVEHAAERVVGVLAGVAASSTASEMAMPSDPGESGSWSSTARPALVSGDGDG